MLDHTPQDEGKYPFCCEHCKMLYRKRLTNENVFLKFKQKSGSSDYTFRVVKKVQRGPILFIKYFTLNNGCIKEVERPNEYKTNSFKIYTCDIHNTYYSINLYSADNRFNYHHVKSQNETEFGDKIINLMKN